MNSLYTERDFRELENFESTDSTNGFGTVEKIGWGEGNVAQLRILLIIYPRNANISTHLIILMSERDNNQKNPYSMRLRILEQKVLVNVQGAPSYGVTDSFMGSQSH